MLVINTKYIRIRKAMLHAYNNAIHSQNNGENKGAQYTKFRE